MQAILRRGDDSGLVSAVERDHPVAGSRAGAAAQRAMSGGVRERSTAGTADREAGGASAEQAEEPASADATLAIRH
ncbi:hypothetical protein GCM10009805_01050 [Leucobacter chromiireducens subsp. solipictus]